MSVIYFVQMSLEAIARTVWARTDIFADAPVALAPPSPETEGSCGGHGGTEEAVDVAMISLVSMSCGWMEMPGFAWPSQR
jgi:hypothetical protein